MHVSVYVCIHMHATCMGPPKHQIIWVELWPVSASDPNSESSPLEDSTFNPSLSSPVFKVCFIVILSFTIVVCICYFYW